MITDSYSASCYIESKDGKYHMECEMNYGDKEIYSDYDGNSFIDGLNTIMDDMTIQMFEPEPEPQPEESLEDKVARLEDLVVQLQAENDDLNDYIESLEDNCEEDCECECDKEDTQTYKIDEAVKQLNDLMDEFINNKKDYNNFYKKLKPAVLRWPYNITTCYL